MEVALDITYLLVGGLILYLGAEWLVKGSAGLAHSFGIKPLIIGLTVVAYGTSAPELAVSTAAILEDSSAIVLGNIIGSNIANIGLILGITALIAPPAVDSRLIRREIPVLLLSSAAVPLCLLDGTVSFFEGLLLTGVAVLFTVYTLFVASDSDGESLVTELPKGESRARLAMLTVIGLALLVGGGKLFVDGAKGMALALGMSERLVGLTVVAVGTSLPELAASVVAALRGYSSLAIGNVVGSNIFNVFLILGVVSTIGPVSGQLGALQVDLYFLGGVTVVGMILMRGQRRISRAEGIVLLVGYVAFVVMASLG